MDGSLSQVSLNGRVVNFETCMHIDRCRAVEGLTVRLRQQTERSSEPTDFPGRFSLPVPTGHEDDLVIESEDRLFAPTIAPWAAPAAIADVYGIELMVMPMGMTQGDAPTLIQALEDLEEPIQLLDEGTTEGQGGYIGQVMRYSEEEDNAVQGATVTVTLPDDWPTSVPEPVVRFFNTIPQYDSGDLLLDEGSHATGSPGLFVIETRGQSAYITVHVRTHDTVFTEIVARVEPGMVTLGLHLP